MNNFCCSYTLLHFQGLFPNHYQLLTLQSYFLRKHHLLPHAVCPSVPPIKCWICWSIPNLATWTEVLRTWNPSCPVKHRYLERSLELASHQQTHSSEYSHSLSEQGGLRIQCQNSSIISFLILWRFSFPHQVCSFPLFSIRWMLQENWLVQQELDKSKEFH